MADKAFRGALGDYVHLIEDETEADKQALLLILLTELGCAAGNSSYYVTGDSLQHTNEFCAIVGESSTSRKGTAQDCIDKLMTRVDPDFMENNRADGLATEQGIVFRLSQQEEAGDTRVLCVEEELESILTKSHLNVILRKSWDSKRVGEQIKSGSYSCKNPHLSIIADITPDGLHVVLPKISLTNGYANRFLWAMARQSKQLPSGGTPLEKLNKGLVNAIVTSLQDGLAFARKAGQVRLDSKALEEVWTPYYMAPPDFDAPVESRKPAHILRLALLYALLDKSRVIRVSHLDAAIAVWEYCQASARCLFSPKHQQQDFSEQKLLTLLRQHPEGLTTAQVTFMAFNNNKDAGGILQKLKEDGKVRSETVKGKGRPAVYWFLSTPPAPGSVVTTTNALVQITPAAAPVCGRALYIPTGRALEYSPWACNPYKGCGHNCTYCFVTKRMKPSDVENFHAGAIPRPGFLDRLRMDAAKLQAEGVTAQVLLSFITDVYNPYDMSLTRPTIEILIEYGLAFTVLTKGGARSLADIDLYRPDRDAYACTLTSVDNAFSKKWELSAALASDRIATLKRFHDRGIFTWVSLEPSLNADHSLAIVRETHEFVDLYKIGKANYIPEAADIDWEDYTHRMIDLCQALDAVHYVKHDLQQYLPAGYHNPMRIVQHK
jgi:DNA repair photolyase